MMAILLATN
jgi:hypothetical protein